MQFTVFNVGHGFCALLIADNGNVALFDCGHDDACGFRPSRTLHQLNVTGIEHFFLSHYDKDHVSDLPNLLQTMPPAIVHTNWSVTPDQVRAIKLRDGPIDDEVQAALNLTANTVPVSDQLSRNTILTGVEIESFYCSYDDFQDTNNLSVVTFIRHNQVSVVVPGDIEKEGWLRLLDNERFRLNLQTVDVFVASHHGRENGFREELFEEDMFGGSFCTPDIVIISDAEIQYASQEFDYAPYALGRRFRSGDTRSCLTTRTDGNITIFIQPGSGYGIRLRNPALLPVPRWR